MAQEKPVNDTLKLIKNRKKKPVSGLLLGAELKGQVKIKMVCLGIYCHTLIAQIEWDSNWFILEAGEIWGFVSRPRMPWTKH